MPFGRFLLKPGVETRLSQSANQGGWSFSQLVRWLGGLPQKIGGWTQLIATAMTGTPRALHAWSDLTGIPYLASGSEQRLQLVSGGTLYDITPLSKTDNISPSFSTGIGSSSVTVTDSANGVVVDDWINLPVVVSVGGLLLVGFHQVQTVIDADNFTITAASNATANITNGGAVPVFTTTMTLATVSVALANHGLTMGQLFNVAISTTVGGIVLNGSYNVTSVTNANTFVITADTIAGSSASGGENGGDVQIQYLLATGFASTTPVSGYGIGLYGAGLYGTGSGSIMAQLRLWFLDNWGQVLIAGLRNGPIYEWTPPNPVPATIVATAPMVNAGTFIFPQEQILVAFGSTTTVSGDTQDPLLVRWSDAGDFTDFIATAINQAGSFHIPTGSKIVGGFSAYQQALIVTDNDAYSMVYLGLPFVFGFNRIAKDCGLLSPFAIGALGTTVMWMSYRNFFILSAGGPQIFPCPVWDQVFGNLNTQQTDKTICAVNSFFGEILFYYASASGNGEIDSYVKYTAPEQAWDYGTLTRTAWAEESQLGPPIGVDENHVLQQHETSNDANGAPLTWFVESGYIDISLGEDFAFIDQFYPDVAAATTPGAQLLITIKTTAFADDTPVVDGPYTAPFPTNLVSTRSRGRQAAVRFGSSDLGSFIRLGNIRFRYSDDGAN